MAEDTRNFIEQTLARAEIIGHDLSPADMATEFAKLGESERVDCLERIGTDLSGSELSVRKAAEFHVYKRALRNTHDTLRKVGR